MGRSNSGRGGGLVNPTYKFRFNLEDIDDIFYVYLYIDAEDVDLPQHDILLNDHHIGYLERTGLSQGVVNAGDKGPRKTGKKSRTARYLPARYFMAGDNVLEIKHQVYRRSDGGYSYEKFYIDNIYLAVIKKTVQTASAKDTESRRSRADFPGHLEFLSALTDKELYIALVKLPFLINELSYPGTVCSNSLGYVYSRIGDYHRWTGDYAANLAYQKKAVVGQPPANRTLLHPYLQSRLALAYYYVGDFKNAVKEGEAALERIDVLDLQESRRLMAGQPEDPLQLRFLIQAYLALFYYHDGNREWSDYYAFRVINHFDDDWGYFGNRKTRRGKYLPVAIAYQTVGDTEARENNFKKSLQYYRKAMEYLNYEVRPEIYNDQMLNIRLSMAMALYRTGELQEARSALASVSNPTNEFLWRSHLLQGMMEEDRGNPESAAGHYLESIREIEFSRAKLTSHGLKINFMTDKQEPYARMVDCLIRLGSRAEAFAYVEKAKARAFLDIIAGTEAVIGRKNSRLSELTDEEKRLRDTLLEIQNRMDMNRRMFEKRGNDPEGTKALRKARKAMADFYADAGRSDFEFTSLRAAETVTLEDLQSVLPEDTALLEYYYRQDQLYIWSVQRTDFHFSRKPIQSGEIEQLVRLFRSLVGHPGEVRGLAVSSGGTQERDFRQDAFREVNDRLHFLLVEGILGHLSAKRLYVVPHGVLHYLPFQALYRDGKYLIESFQIGYLPSASVLQYVVRKPKSKAETVLALGNPELASAAMALPFAEKEVRDIRRFFEKAEVLTGSLASEANFKRNAGRFDIVHVASHGEFDPDTPLLSCLRLTPGEGEDGRLEAREIFNLDLDASLITLSACNTALGKMSKGDELTGLTRAFIYAGTPTILGTFWSVNDASTRLLMQNFYSNLPSMDKFAAMQRAQMDMIRHDRFHHPYYWACFQIIGDAR